MPAQAVIQVRRDSTANWVSAQTAAGSTPLLALGEIGFDTTESKIKIGDGVTLWGSLEYTTTGFEISETEPTGTIRAGDLWFKPTGAEAYIYTTTWVRLNPVLADNEVTTAKINDGAVTTAKIAAGASIDRIGNRRILVTGPTAPATPSGGWNVGDVWISY